jgi:hypothetical protein
MPYLTPFNQNSPTEADFQHQGDDELRLIKRAINERLGTFFTNWPDGEPLHLEDYVVQELIAQASPVAQDLLANRPPAAARAGLIFHALDQGRYYVSLPDLTWAEIIQDQAIQAGLFAGRPAVPADTQMYFALDRRTLYYGHNDQWLAVGPELQHYEYDASLVAGTRATGQEFVDRLIHFRFTGIVAGGTVSFARTEFGITNDRHTEITNIMPEAGISISSIAQVGENYQLGIVGAADGVSVELYITMILLL